MNWLKLLNLLRKFPVGDLLDYPKDITDSAACRRWVLAVLDSFGILAEFTDFELDDEVIGTIKGIIRNDDAWSLIHGVFIRVVGNSEGEIVFRSIGELNTDKTRNIVGFNPMFIMIIIQFVALVLRCIKRPVK